MLAENRKFSEPNTLPLRIRTMIACLFVQSSDLMGSILIAPGTLNQKTVNSNIYRKIFFMQHSFSAHIIGRLPGEDCCQRSRGNWYEKAEVKRASAASQNEKFLPKIGQTSLTPGFELFPVSHVNY